MDLGFIMTHNQKDRLVVYDGPRDWQLTIYSYANGVLRTFNWETEEKAQLIGDEILDELNHTNGADEDRVTYHYEVKFIG